MQLDTALRSIFAKPTTNRATPKPATPNNQQMSQSDYDTSIRLMRINHTGEVCAQALYQGQALTARSKEVKQKMAKASNEELDHLNWCYTRLKQLGGRPSYLNPLWYTGSFTLGALAGVVGDKWSLGFLEETEKQVEAHLAEHLDQLPAKDTDSRAIVEQMKIDEASHAQMARESGAQDLPSSIKKTMKLTADTMKLIVAKI